MISCNFGILGIGSHCGDDNGFFCGVWIRTKSKQWKSTLLTYWEIKPLAIRLGILGTVMVCFACGSQNQTADVAKQHCDVSFEITPRFECVKQICWCQKKIKHKVKP
jgi:hypothetical protein